MIVQPTFDIPAEIYSGILSGDFIRYGGVVRDTAGRLIVHLKEIPAPEKAVESVAVRAAQALKNPWVAVGTGLTLVAVGGGVLLAKKRSKKRAATVEPECVREYRASLQTYLDAIRSGTVDTETIDNLIASLDTVSTYVETNDATVALSPDQLAILTDIVLAYTSELAKVNGIELEKNMPHGDDVVVDLRGHLEAQREAFKAA